MNLVECLENNNMILPDYKKSSIIDAVRTIYNYCGYRYNFENTNKEITQYIKNKKHILLILSDGMGSNLIDLLSDKMLLRKNKLTDLLTVFPTTTGCALSSVATAEYPSTHGMIGWYNHNRDRNIDYYTLLFQERYSGKNLEELGIKEKDIYVCESVLNKLKRKTIALFPETIVNSNFSKFILNKNRFAYNSIEEAFNKATDNIQKNKDTETFTYLYLPYVDSESHYNGVYSKNVNKVINEIEKELIRLISRKIQDLEVIIIADHGQIDVTGQDITMDFEKYKQYFYALPGIDFGTSTYYVKNDKREEFLQEFKRDYEDKMYIFETNEFIKYNIFGKNNVSQYMKSNLGEYISFCKKGFYFVNTIKNTEKYIGKIKGSHSGFSKEELTIPLIVINT